MIRPADPYPGLRPFEKAEWSIFFGREPIIEPVLDRLAANHLVVVHGSSGCGKSSLIRAGVLPRLEQEHARHGVAWRTASMRPGSAPMWNLATAIARLIDGLDDAAEPELARVRTVSRLLNAGPDAGRLIDEHFGLGRSGNVCILLDQFEELFRYAREIGREEAAALIAVLMGFKPANPRVPPGIHAIVTMRSDHLGDCGRFEGFAELVNATQYLLPRMADADLLRAIREPARLFGGDVTPGLAIKLVDESHDEVDALPLVQHALMRLWNTALATRPNLGLAEAAPPWNAAGRSPTPPDPILDIEGYGTLQALLSDHADEILRELKKADPAIERTVEFVFRALCEIDKDGRGIRRPLRLSALIEAAGGDQARVNRIVERYAERDCGFLVRSRDAYPVIDIGHEALIRCWNRLTDPAVEPGTGRPRGWLAREQHDGQLWRNMRAQASERDPIPAERVDERANWLERLPGEGWAVRHGGGWEDVTRLVADSRRRAEQARREAERRQREELEEERVKAETAQRLAIAESQRADAERRAKDDALQSGRRLKRIMLLLGMFVLLSGAFALYAFVQTLRADAAAAEAQAQTREAQTKESLLLAQLADQQIVAGDAVTGMLLALRALPGGDQPDRPLVWQAREPLVQGLHRQRERMVLTGHEDWVRSVAFSPDGARIVSGSDDRTLRLWDAATGRPIGEPLTGHEGSVTSVAVSPDGARIVSGSGDGTLRLWDAATGRPIGEPLTGHEGYVNSVAVSPDGARIVSSSDDRTLRLWEGRGIERLIADARAALPRCLSLEQEKAFFLRPQDDDRPVDPFACMSCDNPARARAAAAGIPGSTCPR